MIQADLVFRLGRQRAQELQQFNRDAATRRAGYLDRERQPRLLKHWANRLTH